MFQNRLEIPQGQRKATYRNLERSTLKLEKNKSHPMFNETCYNNDILPAYTNVK